MSAEGIVPVEAASAVQTLQTQVTQVDRAGDTPFAVWLGQNVERINTSLVRADAVLAQAAVDGSQPPHQVMLALEEARLSFHLALQVRNRLLEGYQELMRMQV